MMGERGGRGALFGVGVMLVLVAVFFADVVFHPRMFLLRDTFCDEFPWREFAGDAIRDGALPQWNPYSACGKPFLAEPKAAVFYPGSALFYVLPPVAAGRIFYPLHFFLAGLFAYLLGREWKLGKVAALVMGMVWAFNGFIVTRVEFQGSLATLALYPLVFLLAHRMLVRPEVWTGIGLAFALCVQFLAGNTPDFYLAWLGIVFYGLFFALFWPAGGERRWRVAARLLYLVPPVVGCGLLAAVQFLPTYYFSQHSWKAGGELAWVEMASMHPSHLAALLVPELFGLPGYETYWGRTIFEFSVASMYVGVLGVMLVSATVVTLARRKGIERRLSWFFWVLLVMSVLVSAGLYAPVFGFVRRSVPFYDQFRWPAKAVLSLVFALTGLAGLGAKEVLLLASDKENRAKGLLWGVWAGVWVLMFGGWVWGKMEPEGARQVFFGFFFRPSYPALTEDLGRVVSIAAWGYVKALWFLGASVAAVGLVFMRKGERAIGVVLPVLLFVDLYAHNAKLNAVGDGEIYEFVPQTVRELRGERGMFRVFSAEWTSQQLLYGKEDLGLFRWAAEMMVGETSLRNRIFKTYGGGTLRITEQEVLQQIAEGGFHVSGDAEAARGRVLDLMNVEFEVRPAENPHAVVFGEGSRQVLMTKRETALPRAFVVSRVDVVEGNKERVVRLLEPSFDIRRAVVLEEPIPGEGWYGEKGGELKWEVSGLEYELDSVSMDVELDDSGVLVVSDTYFPGWKAEVDGKAEKIYRADVAFRAIPLGAGKHKVVMRYAAPWFGVGLLVSGVTALAMLAGGIALSVTRRRREGEAAR